MAWIESHQTLRDHPKTKRLCRLLELPRPMVVGYLHLLWWWALDYAPTGDLSSFGDDDIADAIDWPGDPTALVSALIESGFVDADRMIHDWGDYAGRLIERRRANADRMREARAHRSARTEDTRAGHVQRTHSARVQLPDLTGPDLTGPDHEQTSSASSVADATQDDAPRNGRVKHARYADLSEPLRHFLEAHRQRWRLRRPRSLSVKLARDLEAALLDLGLDRLVKSLHYMADEKEVSDLTKIMRAAYSYRKIQETEAANTSLFRSSRRPTVNGVAPVRVGRPHGGTIVNLDDDDDDEEGGEDEHGS